MRPTIRDDRGELLEAAFNCSPHEGGWSITLEARGGKKGTATARNADYGRGLETLLTRLGQKQFILTEALLDTEVVKRAELSSAERTLLPDSALPLKLAPLTDTRSLAAAMRKSQTTIGQRARAKGGNSTKRIRLLVVPSEATNVADDLEDYLELGSNSPGAVSGWWVGRPEERFWLEITNRTDVGRNLNAPEVDKNGDAHWSYALIREVRPGDVVLHYDTNLAAIVGWSFVAGHAWQDDVVWAARGTRSRLAGIKPHRQPGWYVGLERYTGLTVPVDSSAIAAKRAEILALRQELRDRYGDPIRFPFVPYGERGIRAFQGYLVKFPRRLLDAFSELRPLLSVETTGASAGGRADQVGERVGSAYRPANEELSVAKRDPFDVDPALVERGLRGHAHTQNALAEFISSLGLEPRSPVGGEPNFDLLWECENRLFVAEVKSITAANEEKQLRLGLGQVVRYRQLLASRTAREVVSVLVAEREPRDQTWAELCKALGIFLTWPSALDRLPLSPTRAVAAGPALGLTPPQAATP